MRERGSRSQRRTRLELASAALLVLGWCGSSKAALVLSALVGDHMVLPVVGQEAVLTGRASPGERVSATLGGSRARAQADAHGGWRLTWPLSALEGRQGTTDLRRASLTLRIETVPTRVFRDVVLGEVWLAAGQSNMAMPTRLVDGADRLARDAVAADLRFFRLENDLEDDLTEVRGHWARASIGDAGRFSAVATSFGIARAVEHGRAVGLVQAAWNGTPIASWKAAPASPPSVAEADAYRAARGAWSKRARFREPDGAVPDTRWASPTVDDSAWNTLEVPGTWEHQGSPELDGVVWLRRRLRLPKACRGRTLALTLGPIDDCDHTFVNGRLVGATCHEVGAAFRLPRQYRVPATAVRSADLVLAVRVVDEIGDGGFTGLPAELALTCSPRLALPLAGPWRMRVAEEASHDRPGFDDAPSPPAGWPTPTLPGVFMRTWLPHLVPFPFVGVLWYQGENDLGHAAHYEEALEAWLADWSATLAQPTLPVLLVQLPGHAPALGASETQSEWATVREAQRRLAARHANVGLAVTIDLGQGREIHPTRKREVGERLAWLGAHPSAHATGPWLAAVEVEMGHATLHFEATGALRGGARGFVLRDARGATLVARIEIAPDRIDVRWTPSAPLTAAGTPMSLAYGTGDDPFPEIKDDWLTDDTGLPASPFDVGLAFP